jgi:glycosyltransferase involved in cell wall biosynthesis
MLDITVIIPFYNNPDNLNRALISISNQSIHPSTVIVIDDYSKHYDAITHLIQKEHPFELIISRNKINSGPAVARNLGMEISSSKYIAFLDEDDIWHPSKLRIQFDLMERLDLLISSTGYSTDSVNFEKLEFNKFGIKKISFLLLLIRNQINTSSVMISRDLYSTIKFDPMMRYSEDYDLWLRITSTTRINLISAPLTLRRDGTYHGGLSSNLDKMFRAEKKAIESNVSSLILKKLVIVWLTLKYFKRVLLFNVIYRSNKN